MSKKVEIRMEEEKLAKVWLMLGINEEDIQVNTDAKFMRSEKSLDDADVIVVHKNLTRVIKTKAYGDRSLYDCRNMFNGIMAKVDYVADRNNITVVRV